MVPLRVIVKLIGYVLVYIGPLFLLIVLTAPRQTAETSHYVILGCGLIAAGAVLAWFGRPSKTTFEKAPNACSNCLAPIATKPLRFHQVIGMLIAWQRKTVSGFLCRHCASEYFWQHTTMTMVLGWLGASIFLVPFTLVENLVNYIDSLSLPPRDQEEFELDKTKRKTQKQAADLNAPPREWKARYRVMAYHDSSGIYKLGAEGTTLQIMVPHDDLKLPPELRDRFNQWVRLYDRRKSNASEYEAMGVNLGRELKRFLGADVYVEYRGESAEGMLQPPEPID